MRALQSDYMHWAKFKQPVRYSLTGSEVPHFRMDRLPWTIADLDLDGASHPRYLPLRERIAARYGVTPDQVVTADGTAMANFVAMAAVIAPGDELLIERPVYEPLLAAARFLGADVRRFDRDKDFRLDPAAVEAAVTDNTRLIVATNLHNPSSNLASEADLEEVGRLASAHGARLLVDEVYLDAVTPRPRSAVHLGPAFVTTSSLTKVYGLSGLRCGWVLAEPELAERMWRVNDLFGVNQAHPAERLACIAFDHIDTVIGDSPALLRTNHQRFASLLESRSDLQCTLPEHGTTAFPRWLGGDTERLDAHLRSRYDAAIVPGRWFEMPDHFRIDLAAPEDLFAGGLDRLAQALDDLA